MAEVRAMTIRDIDAMGARIEDIARRERMARSAKRLLGGH
jgi:hypothetical protein